MELKPFSTLKCLFVLLITCCLTSCGDKIPSIDIEPVASDSDVVESIPAAPFRFMTEELPPYNYTEGGELRGLSVDLLNDAMEKINYPVEQYNIKSMPWARAYETVKKESGTALFSMARTEEREKLFKWAGPIVDIQIGVLSKKSRQVSLSSLENISDYKIGTVRSSAPEQLLVSQSDADISSFVRVTNPIQSIQQLQSGRIDLFPFNIPTAMYLIESLGLDPDDFEVVYTLKDISLYYAFNKSVDDAFISELNKAIVSVKSEQVQSVDRPIMQISGHPDYPPFMWRSGDRIVGIGVELAQIICEELNIECDVRYAGPWKRVQENGRLGKIDLIVGIYKNEDRQIYLDYSDAYMTDPTSVAVRRDSTFPFASRSSLVDLTGVTMHGDSFGRELDEFIDKELDIQRAHNSKAIFKNLMEKRVEYILWGRYPILTNASKLGHLDSIEVLDPPVAVENMFMAFSKMSPFKRYLPQVNTIIERLRSDRTFERLSKKYLDIHHLQLSKEVASE